MSLIAIGAAMICFKQEPLTERLMHVAEHYGLMFSNNPYFTDGRTAPDVCVTGPYDALKESLRCTGVGFSLWEWDDHVFFMLYPLEPGDENCAIRLPQADWR